MKLLNPPVLRNRSTPIVLIVVGVLVIAQASLAPLLRKEIVIKGGEYNAGSVKSGSIIHSTMSIYNFSPFPIQVHAMPACGCTILSLTSGTIDAFHHASLSSAVNTAALRPGEIHKAVSLDFQLGAVHWQHVAHISATIR